MEDLNDSIRKDEKCKDHETCKEEDKTKKCRIEVEELNRDLKNDNDEDFKWSLEFAESVILARKVFGNPLILRHILRRLPTFYLRYLRLVNKMWEELVTDILIRRGDKGIYFVYDEDTKLSHKFSHPDMPFMDFVECVKASKRFPCSKFWIQMPNFEDEDMKDFLSAVGKQIKVLELKNGENSYAKMSRQVLKSLLLTHCPNIRELRIFDNSDITDESPLNSNQDNNSVPESANINNINTNTKDIDNSIKSSLLPEKYILPNLEVFGVEGTRTEKNVDVCEILLASPHLKKFYGDSVLYFDDLVKANKIHSIRDLDFVDPLLTEQAHRLSQLEEFRPQIEDIYVYPVDVLEDEQKMSSFLKILEASKTSLNSVYFYLESRFFKPGDLPILPTVSEVELVSGAADGDEDEDDDDDDDESEEENENDNEEGGGGGDNNRHDQQQQQQQQNDEHHNNDNNNQDVERVNNIIQQVPGNDNEEQEQEEQNEIPTFPATFLLHTFPNLKKLHLRFSCTNIRYDGPPILHTILTSDVILPTVTILDLHGDLHHELARHIPTVFPNVKDFLSGTIHDFPTVSKYIWEMKKLQWLTLNILVDGETECANSIPQVDAAFIGMDPEDLKNIDNPGAYAKSMQGNIIRKNSSILDLKDLTSLKIDLRLANDKIALPVTDHTFELAFRFMCGLKIQMKTYAQCSN